MKNPITGDDISNKDLASVSRLCNFQLGLEREVETLEQALKLKKEQLKLVSETQLPETLMQLGMTEIKLTDGSEVKVEKFYAAHITSEKKDEAFSWLEKNGHDSIVKSQVIIEVDKGNAKELKRVLTVMKNMKISHDLKQAVHHATLKAFIRDQVESGQTIPLDLFGAYIGNRTKITTP